MGTEYYGNETTYRPIFGVVEMAGLEAPLYVRHQLTDELVGNAFSWSYSDQVTSMHVYASPHSMSWVIFTGAPVLGGGVVLSLHLREVARGAFISSARTKRPVTAIR
ncbi:MAG: MoaF C-terminal domain-containing protein [Steroidobacteraceae bacterium]